MNYSFGLPFRIRFILLVILSAAPVFPESQNIMMIIIDGARYSETFGDETRSLTPKMWELSQEGSILTRFYNDSMTYTARAIPALWCGSWTDVRDTVYKGIGTSYAVKPTIFEYYRKQMDRGYLECFYILKYISSLWLASFDPEYGPDYWPAYHSVGSTDAQVATQVENIMNIHHPPFILVYLADVDAAGHSGDWNRYIRSLAIADSIVFRLWNKIRNDEYYQDRTSLFVTNDHGRHDDQHGGFSGHGCGCEGCRHIQFLALGPEIKKNFSSSQYRRIPDFAVTAAATAGFTMPRATGDVMDEIFVANVIEHIQPPELSIQLLPNYPNPFNSETAIRYHLGKRHPMSPPHLSQANVELNIFTVTGEKITTLVSAGQSLGEYTIHWDASAYPSGVYIYQLSVGNPESGVVIKSRKMILLN